ncbi:MAG: YHYH protein [Candidatus Kapabacteria bacterium]|nr:YHYH protein [Candidatus Kapabacteria bacterium]
MKKTILILILIMTAFKFYIFAHNIDSKNISLREWKVENNTTIFASFLMIKNERVYLEKENNEIINYPLASLSNFDQKFVLELEIASNNISNDFDINKLIIVLLFLSSVSILIYIFSKENKYKYATYFMFVGLFSILYSFKPDIIKQITSATNPLSLDSACIPFKPNVATRWDETYFYIESKGIPTTHSMMVGITGWQQQVPIPQCYIGKNAWSIPLNPTIASSPVPVSPAHFSRGAIAIAVNGIAIFNPYTNTGVDALVDGQLDNWGGHCGRADDYHYHIAPLHLYDFTSKTLPVAYGLDGYAIFGAFEPDGNTMLPLDKNHGHFGNDGVYHYHGTKETPYMIANMVGKITEDNTFQIIPQASAQPIRPSGTPLKGAVITNLTPNGTNNGYSMTYTLNNQSYHWDYSWNNSGSYTFNYVSPSSNTIVGYKGFTQCTISSGTLTNTLQVSKSNLTIGSIKNSLANFDIISNTSWDVTSSQKWLTLSTNSGTLNKTITLTAASNTQPNTRTAYVTVSAIGVNSQTITVIQDAGLTDVEHSISNNFNFYTNPSNDEIIIELNNEVSIEDIDNISIYDYSGKLVFSINGYQNRINALGFGKGIFLIVLKTNNNIYSDKLIIN